MACQRFQWSQAPPSVVPAVPAQEAPLAVQPVNVNVTVELDKKVLAKHTEQIVMKMLNPARVT